MKTDPAILEFSAVILAGGQSRRMGRDKAWLETDGVPLIRLAVEKVRALGVAEIFISGRDNVDYSALKCPVLRDLEPGLGPLGGIERALQACAAPLLLVLAVDLPRLRPEFLRRLLAQCRPLTGVVPKLRGELEPLAAVYPRRCHAYASAALAKSRLAVRDFAAACLHERAVRAWPVPPAAAVNFNNWNTPADQAAASDQIK